MQPAALRSLRLTPGPADGRGTERRRRRAIAGALLSIIFLALGASAAGAADTAACRDVAAGVPAAADGACNGTDAVRDVVAPAAAAVTTASEDAAIDPGPVAVGQTGATQTGDSAAEGSDAPATKPSANGDAPATGRNDAPAKSPGNDPQGGQATSEYPTDPGKADDGQAGAKDKGGAKNDAGDRGSTRNPPRNGGDRPTNTNDLPSRPTDNGNGNGNGKVDGGSDADGSSGNASDRPTQPTADTPGTDKPNTSNPSPATGTAGSGNGGSSQDPVTRPNGGGGKGTDGAPTVSGTGIDDVLTGMTGTNAATNSAKGKGTDNTAGNGATADDKTDPVASSGTDRSGPVAAPAGEAAPSAVATAPRFAGVPTPVAMASSEASGVAVLAHASAHVRRTARGSHPLVTVPATGPVNVADQTLVGVRTDSPGFAGDGRPLFAHGPTPFDALRPDRWVRERGAAQPAPEPVQASSNFLRAAAAASGADADSGHHAGSRPTAAHVPHGGGGLPEPTPFAPPGRGAVGGASGAPGATAGSAVTCAILVGFLLLTCPPLRRFRLLPVAAAPAGFPLLQQRPG